MKFSIILLITLIIASVLTVDIEKELSVKNFYETRQRLQGIAYHTPL